ncbi:hypothetical protein [Pseudobacteriovorax antillogorgiicola]|uniref:hypothetical protein n=1 Tax=Pseudobacteriovorax antillogorgiicola TaxID=1513793 RepID=UPI001F16CD8F|nr:hypothetical protein [Pseudobacteriovorax antillogorgiicola]
MIKLLLLFSSTAFAETSLESYELLSIPDSRVGWFSNMGSHYKNTSSQSPTEDRSFKGSADETITPFVKLGLDYSYLGLKYTRLEFQYGYQFAMSDNGSQWAEGLNLDALNQRVLNRSHHLGATGTYQLHDFELGLESYLVLARSGLNTLSTSDGQSKLESRSTERFSVYPQLSYRWLDHRFSIKSVLMQDYNEVLEYLSFKTFGNDNLSLALAHEFTFRYGLTVQSELLSVDYTFNDPLLNRTRQAIQISLSQPFMKDLLAHLQLALFRDEFSAGRFESQVNTGLGTNGISPSLIKSDRNDQGQLLAVGLNWNLKGLELYSKLQYINVDADSQANDIQSNEVMFGINFGKRLHKDQSLMQDLVRLNTSY